MNVQEQGVVVLSGGAGAVKVQGSRGCTSNREAGFFFSNRGSRAILDVRG